MSKKSNQDIEQQFSAWLESKTNQQSTQDRSDSQEAFNASEDLWRDRQKTANYLAHQSEVISEQKVPNWDRSSTFISDQKPWWQWSALPAMSFAFSCFAIALVLLKVELIVKPEGVMLSFADSAKASQAEDVEKLIDQKLQTFASEQQVILANYAADIKVKQQDSNLQLATYVIGASRQERKEDMNDFIKYINQQRADEQFDQNMKFKQLEQAIRYNTTSFDTESNDISLQTSPADWTTEE